MQGAGIGIDDDHCSIGDGMDAGAETHEHGHVHRRREDGHMRCGSTAAETNCDESRSVESGQFRRQQVLCDDHRVIGDG